MSETLPGSRAPASSPGTTLWDTPIDPRAEAELATKRDAMLITCGRCDEKLGYVTGAPWAADASEIGGDLVQGLFVECVECVDLAELEHEVALGDLRRPML